MTSLILDFCFRDNMTHSIADVQPPLRVDIRYNNLNNGNKIQASDMQFELLDKRAHFENDLSTAGLSTSRLKSTGSFSISKGTAKKSSTFASAHLADSMFESNVVPSNSSSMHITQTNASNNMNFSFSTYNKQTTTPPLPPSAKQGAKPVVAGLRGLQYQRNLSAIDLLTSSQPNNDTSNFGPETQMMSGYNSSDYEGGDDSDVEGKLQSKRNTKARKTKSKKQFAPTGAAGNNGVMNILQGAGLGDVDMTKLSGLISNIGPITESNLDSHIRRLQDAILTAKMGTAYGEHHSGKANDHQSVPVKLTRRRQGSSTGGQPARPQSANPHATTKAMWDINNGPQLTGMSMKERTMKMTKAIYYNKPPEGFNNNVLAGGNKAGKAAARPKSAPANQQHANSQAVTVNLHANTTLKHMNGGSGAATIALLTQAANNILPTHITDTLGTLTYTGNFDPSDEIKGPMKRLAIPLALYGPSIHGAKKPVVNLKQKTKEWTQQKVERDRAAYHSDQEMEENMRTGRTVHAIVGGKVKHRSHSAAHDTSSHDDFADIGRLSKMHPATLF
jgi:hypothetical protein